ncbi:MAG: hypothetical protein E7012_05915 [Alphaproteobacteria bacterium]|nr:hypothetical protein [Alphaproteobacteria bacterium]
MKKIFTILKKIFLLIIWLIVCVLSFAIFILLDLLELNYDVYMINSKWVSFVIILYIIMMLTFLLELYLSRQKMMIIIPILIIFLAIHTLIPGKYQLSPILQSKLSGYNKNTLYCLYTNEDKEICFDRELSKLDAINPLYKKIGYQYCDKKNYIIANSVAQKQCYYEWLLFGEKTYDTAK